MTRPVDPADVLALIPGTALADLLPFIKAANALVNRLAATPCGSGLSDAELEEIEKWLAAHFASMADPALSITQQTVEGSSVTLGRGTTGSSDGIMSSVYGQTANALSGGCLAEMTKPKPSISFF